MLLQTKKEQGMPSIMIVSLLLEKQEQQNTEMSAAPHRMHGLLDFPMWKTRIL